MEEKALQTLYALTGQIGDLLARNLDWMGWNLFLALIPLALGLWLFEARRLSPLLWWPVAAVWLAFLPNAPYVLTDIVHLIEQIRTNLYSVWVVSLALIPLFILFFLIGFEAYVLSLILLERFVQRRGLGGWATPLELVLHALSAVGIYLGRFLRFNSWDIVTQPGGLVTSLDALIAREPLVVMAATFVILLVLYRLVKIVTLALMTYLQPALPLGDTRLQS